MRHDLELASILAVARAARDLERNAVSADFRAEVVIRELAMKFADRAATLVETILDYEERVASFGEHWRRWRRRSWSSE